MDTRLRELERSWLATGDTAAERRYLHERQRQGTIRWDTIEMAAYLGDLVALSLLGEDADAFEPSRGLIKLVRELPQRDADVMRRIAFAMIEAALGELSTDAGADAARVLARARAQADVPDTSSHLDGEVVPRRQDLEALAGDPARACAMAAGTVLAAAAGRSFPQPGWYHVLPGAEGWAWAFDVLVAAGPPLSTSSAVRAAAIDALLPWVLLREEPPSTEDLFARMVDAELEARVRKRRGWTPERHEQEVEHLRAIRDHSRAEAELRTQQRLARQRPNQEALFTPGSELTLKEATTIQEAVGGQLPRALKAPQASAALDAYYQARGWRRVRFNLMAPSGQRRIALKSRVLRVEEGGPGTGARPTPPRDARSDSSRSARRSSTQQAPPSTKRPSRSRPPPRRRPPRRRPPARRGGACPNARRLVRKHLA